MTESFRTEKTEDVSLARTSLLSTDRDKMGQFTPGGEIRGQKPGLDPRASFLLDPLIFVIYTSRNNSLVNVKRARFIMALPSIIPRTTPKEFRSLKGEFGSTIDSTPRRVRMRGLIVTNHVDE